MVPEGWLQTTVGRIAELQRGFDLPSARRIDGPFPIISSSGRSGYHAEARVKGPGIVTGRYGSIGEIFFINEDHWPLNTALWVKNFHGNDRRFVYYLLQTVDFHKYSDKTGVPGVNRNDIHRIPSLLPPLAEQKKIADILSTWDKAIETTEKLLANTEVQKRGLMQQLLTGERRLKGFEGSEWRETHLRDIAKVIVSNVDKKSAAHELPVRLCNYTDVYKRDFILPTQMFMEATATAEQVRKFRLKVGDVIITKDSETADDIAKPSYVVATADDLICGYHLAIIRPGKGADGRYLKFFFELPRTRHYFGTRANGAIRYGLTIDGIEGAEIRLPPIEEQRRIAAIMVAAEEAISDHRREIHLLRTAKTFLMKQLLTGKRRVSV